MNNNTVLKIAGMHIAFYTLSALITMNLHIPGQTTPSGITGSVILTAYTVVLLLLFWKSSKQEKIILEIWKLLIILACAVMALTGGNRMIILSFIFLGPFNPIILYGFESGLLFIVLMLIMETAVEMILTGYYRRRRPA